MGEILEVQSLLGGGGEEGNADLEENNMLI